MEKHYPPRVKMDNVVQTLFKVDKIAKTTGEL